MSFLLGALFSFCILHSFNLVSFPFRKRIIFHSPNVIRFWEKEMEKSCLLLSFSLDSSTQVDATETDSVMSLEGTSPLDFFNDRLSEHKSSGAHK